MSDGITTLDLTMPPGASLLRVRVNGELVAEAFPGGSATPRDWEAELQQARASLAACRLLRQVLPDLLLAEVVADHTAKSGKERRANFAAGLEAGLKGETVPYSGRPGEGHLPQVPPEHTPSYRRGYELGDALRRAVTMTDGGGDA